MFMTSQQITFNQRTAAHRGRIEKEISRGSGVLQRAEECEDEAAVY